LSNFDKVSVGVSEQELRKVPAMPAEATSTNRRRERGVIDSFGMMGFYRPPCFGAIILFNLLNEANDHQEGYDFEAS
jgi:hypothetical protein